MSGWQVLLGIITGLALVYAVLLVLLWGYARAHPDTVGLRDALRLLPDLIRLLRRLLADATLPAGVRVRVALLVAYLVVPFDLVPDIVPVIGYADDAVVVALVLRSVVRRAGVDAVNRHWPGTPEGLELVLRLAGVR